MENLKEEGGETSLNCGTIRMITKRGEIVMEKRPDNRPMLDNSPYMPNKKDIH